MILVSDRRTTYKRVTAHALMAVIPLLVAISCREGTGSIIMAAGSLDMQTVEVLRVPASEDPTPEQMAVATEVPGFGGYFLDEDGRPTVYLTDVAWRDAAERSLASFLEQRGLHAADLQVRQAGYRYAQLRDWYNQAHVAVFSVTGAVLGEVDASLNRLRFGVTSPTAAAAVLGALTAYDIPVAAFLIEEVAPPSGATRQP